MCLYAVLQCLLDAFKFCSKHKKKVPLAIPFCIQSQKKSSLINHCHERQPGYVLAHNASNHLAAQ